MSRWSVIRPVASTNYVVNPSFETGTTGWTATSGALSRAVGAGAQGAYGGRLLASAANGRAETANLLTTSGSTDMVASAWVDADSASVFLQLYNQTDGGVVAETAHPGDGTRTRLTAAGTVATGKAVRVRIIDKRTSAWANVDFDGVQLEIGRLVATTYIDGDRDGCAWNGGTAHSTATSSRSGQSRAGGDIVDLGDYIDHIRTMGGVGMPPLDVIASEYAILDGGRHQRTRAKRRPFVLGGMLVGATTNAIHEARDGLLALLAPNQVVPQQPIILRYETRSGKHLRIQAHYEGGLEMENFAALPIEDVAIRFVALDPYWESEVESAASLTPAASVTNANRILQRDRNGQWAALGTGAASGQVRAIAFGPDGTLYAVGSFTLMGGIANTVGVARWDGTAWSAMGTGVQGLGSVNALAVAANGDVYLAGTFTTVGGVANTTNIARWDGSAWNALATGTAGEVAALAIGQDGTLYVGGLFTGAGGVANTARIARWDGSAWSALGTGMTGIGTVFGLAVGLDGSLYAGGSFTQMGGVANTLGVARWDGTAWSALDTGITGTIQDMGVGPSGALFVGGGITAAGPVTVNNAAMWNGSSWSALGTGLDSGVWTVTPTPGGGVILGGQFTTAGGLTLPDRVVEWTGSGWIPLEVDLPGTPTIYAAAFGPEAIPTLTLGFDTAGSAEIPTANIAVANNGSAPAYPRLVISNGAGEVPVSFTNWTTGRKIIFDSGMVLTAGHTFTLDLTPGRKTFRSNRPPPNGSNLAHRIKTGSDLATWALQPGTNSVTNYARTGSALVASLTWRERFLSVDGSPT